MPDLLVPLYKLPALPQAKIDDLRETEGITFRRAHPFDLSKVRRFIEKHFSETWADEAEAAFARLPITCYIAIHDKKIIGFACIESTAKAFFGPTGVDEAYRGKGVGAVLLLQSLHALRDRGYGYGIIGAAGPVEFYVKAVGAIPIADSWPGVYTDLLGPDREEKS